MATCSVACSKTHKDQFSCTGERDKTVFVPFADYTEGQMMSGAWKDGGWRMEDGGGLGSLLENGLNEKFK